MLKAFWSRLSFRVRLFFGAAQLPTFPQLVENAIRHRGGEIARNVMKNNVFFQHMAKCNARL